MVRDDFPGAFDPFPHGAMARKASEQPFGGDALELGFEGIDHRQGGGLGEEPVDRCMLQVDHVEVETEGFGPGGSCEEAFAGHGERQPGRNAERLL
jgi:hypothetical protein